MTIDDVTEFVESQDPFDRRTCGQCSGLGSIPIPCSTCSATGKISKF
ncbi:hypothetical protein [Herbidospora sp. RD11066]